MPKWTDAEWVKNQWSQMRGNAKWDFLKTVMLAILIAGGIFIGFIRGGSAWQVFGPFALVLSAFVCFAFLNSKIGRIAAGVLAGLAIVYWAIFAFAFYNTHQPKTITAQPINNMANQNTGIIQTVSAPSGTNSPIFNGVNMSANSAINPLVFAGNINNPQSPISAPNSVFNYYNVPISNSVTRDAFESFEGSVSNAISNASGKLDLTTQQVQLLAQALKDLDQRTSGIQKLPDGRTQLGGGEVIFGVPTVFLEAANAGINCFNHFDYSTALKHFVDAINIMEASKPPIILDPRINDFRGPLYGFAARCAQNVRSNDIANVYAEKAFEADASPMNKILYTSTLANLAEQSLAKGDFQKAFDLISMAITNYESVKTIERDFLLGGRELTLYRVAANAANMLGKSNEFHSFSDTANVIQTRYQSNAAAYWSNFIAMRRRSMKAVSTNQAP
jgi:tetratricopeptide (TPR) repeat protein